ncbi:TetR/AcrR family transcriptional regulator [Streptomyces lincolnensis]|uniref:TetR/AcrR family transcriptional regulator n=1 Tax=Streptomyces lincolnensis TaxID=1915 RepID=UPI0037D93205
MSTDRDTSLRADARRNRDQIVDAAKTVFQEQGPEVPMEEIARRAGVGVGTLYRRFPDRDSLIGAVARDSFGRVRDEVRAVTAKEPGAWETVARLLAYSREMRVMVQLGFSERARTIKSHDPFVRGIQEELTDLLDRLVVTAQEEGTLRPDIGSGDFSVLLSLLVRHLPAAQEELADMVLHRATAVILDGLRTPGGPLPGRALTAPEVL